MSPRHKQPGVRAVAGARRLRAAAHAIGRARGVVLAAAAALLGLLIYQGVAIAAGGHDTVVAVPGGPVAEATPPAPATAAVAAAELTEVTVEIGVRARLRPLPGLPCQLRLGEAEVAQPEVEWLAGSAAMPLQQPRLHDAQLVRVAVHGQPTLRLARVRDDGSVKLRLGGSVQVRGEVLDTTGNRIAGARIWAAGAATTTGDDGAFAVAVIAGDDLPVVAIADGMAAQTMVLDAWNDCSVRFVLQPGGQIRARVIGTLPGDPAAAQVFVLPPGQPSTSAEAQYPFFLQALEGGAPLAANGMVTLRNLPIGARVRLRLQHPRAVAESEGIEVRARPRDTHLFVERAPVVSGRVLDGDAQPQAGAVVCTWPETDGDGGARIAAAALALPALAYCGRGNLVRADATGAFCLARSGRAKASRVLAARTVATGAVGTTAAWAGEVTITGSSDIVHDLVVPSAVAVSGGGGAPALSLRADHPGNYRVRIVEHGAAPRPPVSWTGAEPLPIPLRAAVLADVQVSVGGSDGKDAQPLRSLTIVAPTEIAVSSSQRRTHR